MKKYTIAILFLLAPFYVNGQLYNMSDHYVYDAHAINPAYAGSQDALSISAFYRNSWNGFEGAPKTMSLSAHAPLNNEKVGLGLLILNDKIGVSQETNLVVNYAYRIDLGYGRLAFGLGADLTILSTDWTKLETHDDNDTFLANSSTTGIVPDFSTGIYYLTEKYFVGLSIPLFLSHNYDTKKGKYLTRNDFGEYNYFLDAGYILSLGADVRLFPALLLKYHKGNAVQIEINSQVIFKDKIWLGAAYRSSHGIAGLLQYQVNNQLRIAYSYDFSIGNYSKYNINAHEIMLNYVFNYNAEVPGPRQF